MFKDEIQDITTIVRGRYLSNSPKKIFLVKTDLFKNTTIEQFDIIKIENNLIFGWLWRNNIKEYIQFSIDFSTLDTEIKPFLTKYGAENYYLWLIMQGNKNNE